MSEFWAWAFIFLVVFTVFRYVGGPFDVRIVKDKDEKKTKEKNDD